MTIDWNERDREREAERRLAETHAVPLYRPAKPMGVAMQRALRPILKEAGPAPETLKSRWPEIVGLKLAAVTSPVRVSRGKGGNVRIDYRPVHEYTLTDDVEYIKPKKRVY